MTIDDLKIGNWYHCKALNREWIIQYARIKNNYIKLSIYTILSDHSCYLEDIRYYNEKQTNFCFYELVEKYYSLLIETIMDIRKASEEEVSEYFPKTKYIKKEEIYEIY